MKPFNTNQFQPAVPDNIIQQSTSKFDGIMNQMSQNSSLRWLGAGVSLVLFTAVISLSYTLGIRDVEKGAVPIIVSDGSPVKIRPQNPGGKQFPYQDMTVYQTIRGEQPNNSVILADAPEQPAALSPAEQARRQMGQQVPQQAQMTQNNNINNSPMMMQDVLTDVSQSVVTEKNNVQKEPQFASLLNEQTPQAKVHIASQDHKTEIKPTDKNAINPQVKTFVQKTQIMNSKPAEKLPSAVPTAGVNKNVNNVISLTPVKAVQVPKAESATMKTVVETPKTVPSTANAYIQVGSYRSEQEAQKAWQKISSIHTSSLGGAGHNITKADIAGRGTFYRLRVGPYNTRSDASSVCGNLSAKGQGCLVTN